MAIIPKILKGGLDLNSSIATIAPTNYIDAVDVTDKSVNLKSGQNIWQLNNNADYAFSVGSIVAQPKIYRLSIDFTVDNEGLSTPFGTNIVLVIEKAGAYRELLTLNDGNDGSLITTWETDIIDALTIDNPLLDTTILASNIVGNNLTIDFQCDYFGNTDWIFNAYMEVNVDGTFYYSTLWKITVNALQDAFSVEKTGDLTPIMIANKGNEVMLFNTTGNKEEESLNVYIQYNGGVWEISTSFDFINGEEVFVNGTSDDGTIIVSGYFTVSTYPPSYKLEQTLNPIGSVEIIGDGTYKITRFRNTASTIGLARKNENSGEWNYTELLRSSKLNFRTYSQIKDAIITSTDFGVNSDWTDGLNPIRRLLYQGEWMTNGFLTVYNPKALYSLDTVGEESKLQLGQNTAKVTMSVSQIGGTKPETTYIAFVRFGSVTDGVQTMWSHYSNFVWTHSNNFATHQVGDATTFSLIIKVEQIPLNQFSTMQIGIVQFGTNDFIGYTLPEVQISGVTEISVTDIGDTARYITWDAKNEVEIPSVVFETANNLLDFDNYIVAADVKLAIPYDLSEWAQSFEFSTAVRPMQITGDYAERQGGQFFGTGYNLPLYMTNEWMSCMPSEWHRIGIAVEWKSGAPTSYFWCEDHYIDPDLTKYQVTNESQPTVNIYQYYIEVVGIDMNYLLPDGKLLKDVVKDIRFARTAVVQEVLATGGVITSYSDISIGKRFLNYNYPFDNSINNLENNGIVAGFYSPDLINNGQSILYKAGDEMVAIAPVIQRTYAVVDGGVNTQMVAIDYFGNKTTLLASTYPITATQDLATGADGEFLNLRAVVSPITTNGTIKNLGCISMKFETTPLPNNAFFIGYYRRPISTGTTDSPYKTNPITDKFFIVPQDIWYDETTHNTGTVYKIFSGDCFPQKQYYRIATDNETSPIYRWANLVGFYSYNRSNGAMRSGTPIGYGFPYQSVENMLTDNTISEDYLYDRAFTPRNQFQSALPYNPNLIYTSNTIATIYYSGKRLNGALYGNNRIWDFNSNGVLENVYGRITDLSILLGTSGNNAIFVKQERNTTLQYFDNTARLVTTSVEAILGTGGILDTKGTFLTVSGSSHKFAKTKCLSPTSNKEFDIWFDVNTRTFNRFGSDGSRIISDSIASFLLKYTTLGNLNEYNNPDRPAHDYGILARWDNQKKEYVCTFRLVAKHREITDDVPNLVGDIVTNGDVFGFENFPVLYKCIKYNVNQSPLNTEYFTKYNSYIDDLHQCYTLVWNELDNAWKGFYSYLPNIYGNSANNYLSASPVSKNLLYEHNKNNEARYYCSVPELGGDNGFSIVKTSENITITSIADADNIATWFGVSSFPYYTTTELNNHTSYYIFVQGIYVRITSFLSAYSVTVDVNEPLTIDPAGQFEQELYYSTCNTGQPLIEGVFNEGYPRYFSFGDIQLNVELPPSRIETIGGLDSIGQKTTQSYMEYTDFKYAQGQARVASGMDTTNGKTNKRGLQGIEGYWMKLKTFFQPNIKNKMQNQQLIAVEQNKKMK